MILPALPYTHESHKDQVALNLSIVLGNLAERYCRTHLTKKIHLCNFLGHLTCLASFTWLLGGANGLYNVLGLQNIAGMDISHESDFSIGTLHSSVTLSCHLASAALHIFS